MSANQESERINAQLALETRFLTSMRYTTIFDSAHLAARCVPITCREYSQKYPLPKQKNTAILALESGRRASHGTHNVGLLPSTVQDQVERARRMSSDTVRRA